MIVYNSSSTGKSETLSGGPFTRIAVEVEGGPGTVAIEGQVGSDWTALIASSTFPAAGLVDTSTGVFLVSNVRANISAVGSTAGIKVHLLGA